MSTARVRSPRPCRHLHRGKLVRLNLSSVLDVRSPSLRITTLDSPDRRPSAIPDFDLSVPGHSSTVTCLAGLGAGGSDSAAIKSSDPAKRAKNHTFARHGRDPIGGKRMTNLEAVREIVLHVGCAAGSVFGLWSELSVKTLALVLADISDKEADARAVEIGEAERKLSERKQERLRREIARWEREG